jgi:hypothetical protein
MAQIGIDKVHECRTAHSRQPLQELRIVQEGFESVAVNSVNQCHSARERWYGDRVGT